MATALAHPNIALVKYWGKRAGGENIPATPSLSLTLDALATRTAVVPAPADSLRINGARVRDAKVAALLAKMRAAFGFGTVAIASRNDFPTAAGLASSASGFAALVTAIDAAFGLGLDAAERSVWARRGSASAARSVFGGFATLAADTDWAAAPLLGKNDWPLEVVVAVVSNAAKPVPSTLGMERARTTSPYFDGWTRSAPQDFAAARDAVRARDFTALAEVAERSCLKMHGLMLSGAPPLLYWNETTLAAIHAVCRLRAAGVPVFFTVDAGPQVKAVCAPGHGAAVARELTGLAGVRRVVCSGLGTGARVEADAAADAGADA